jgi:hypothetical protein
MTADSRSGAALRKPALKKTSSAVRQLLHLAFKLIARNPKAGLAAISMPLEGRFAINKSHTENTVVFCVIASLFD